MALALRQLAIVRTIQKPANRANIDARTEADTYPATPNRSPRPYNKATSRENVENVVKAPNRPTINIALMSGVGDHNPFIASTSIPMMRDPTTLTTTVPQGNCAPN